ncbi:MAG: hypothetical protein Q9219_004665 [cf. Caloplaca sp. 3 TL-2023]
MQGSVAWSLASSVLFLGVASKRLEPTEPFTPPLLVKDNPKLSKIFDELGSRIQNAASANASPWRSNMTSFSVAVTSAAEDLWTSSYTAPILGNYTDSPPTKVTENTFFRIASISKVFTVLATLIQQQANNCSLQDSITKHVPELRDHNTTGAVDWDMITLEMLASQLSGIPRECLHARFLIIEDSQSDLIDPFEDHQYGFENPIEAGLPPVVVGDIPPCGKNRPGTRPCSRKGFALESISGLPYEDMVDRTIFQTVGMDHARFSKPPDFMGVIPEMTNDWSADIGTYGPTGGIYTSASDLARFGRAILTGKLLDEATTNGWFQPHSFSESWYFAYGMPWETFHTQDLLPDSERIQTMVTKAGGLRGYTSQLVLIPEYKIGIVVLVAGDGHALWWLRDEILKAFVPAVEGIAREQVAERLSGTYVSSSIQVNSSINFEVQDSAGLMITSWVSNGTDFLARYFDMSQGPGRRGLAGGAQLIPAGIKRGAEREVWRVRFIPEELPMQGIIDTQLITDVDTFTYASRSVEEFVFRVNDAGIAKEVELPAFRIVLERKKHPRYASALVDGSQQVMKSWDLERHQR